MYSELFPINLWKGFESHVDILFPLAADFYLGEKQGSSLRSLRVEHADSAHSVEGDHFYSLCTFWHLCQKSVGCGCLGAPRFLTKILSQFSGQDRAAFIAVALSFITELEIRYGDTSLQHYSFGSSFFGCPGSFMLLRELYDFFFLFYVKNGLGILVRITLTPLIAFSKMASFTEPIKYKLASSKFHDYVKLGSLAMALLATKVPTM